MVIDNFFLGYIVSIPSIIFMGLVLLKLIASSYFVPQGCSYLVSCFWELSGCAGMVKSVITAMNLEVALWFIFLCLLVHYWSLSGWFFLPLLGSAIPIDACIYYQNFLLCLC